MKNEITILIINKLLIRILTRVVFIYEKILFVFTLLQISDLN